MINLEFALSEFPEQAGFNFYLTKIPITGGV